MTTKICRIHGCCEPAVPNYFPHRCAEHKADRQRKQAASARRDTLIALPMGAKCPDCGVPLGEIPFRARQGHETWNGYRNEEIARRIRERNEHKRADADRALALLEALRDVHGIDLLSGR